MLLLLSILFVAMPQMLHVHNFEQQLRNGRVIGVVVVVMVVVMMRVVVV